MGSLLKATTAGGDHEAHSDGSVVRNRSEFGAGCAVCSEIDLSKPGTYYWEAHLICTETIEDGLLGVLLQDPGEDAPNCFKAAQEAAEAMGADVEDEEEEEEEVVRHVALPRISPVLVRIRCCVPQVDAKPLKRSITQRMRRASVEAVARLSGKEVQNEEPENPKKKPVWTSPTLPCVMLQCHSARSRLDYCYILYSTGLMWEWMRAGEAVVGALRQAEEALPGHGRGQHRTLAQHWRVPLCGQPPLAGAGQRARD